jgi:hypothetical protein
MSLYPTGKKLTTIAVLIFFASLLFNFSKCRKNHVHEFTSVKGTWNPDTTADNATKLYISGKFTYIDKSNKEITENVLALRTDVIDSRTKTLSPIQANFLRLENFQVGKADPRKGFFQQGGTVLINQVPYTTGPCTTTRQHACIPPTFPEISPITENGNTYYPIIIYEHDHANNGANDKTKVVFVEFPEGQCNELLEQLATNSQEATTKCKPIDPENMIAPNLVEKTITGYTVSVFPCAQVKYIEK